MCRIRGRRRWESLFVDIYYDTSDRELVERDGALRQRKRYRDTLGNEPRDCYLQARGRAVLREALFFRDEITGTKYRDPTQWDSAVEDALSGISLDGALAFAREVLQDPRGDRPLLPVLEVHDVRYRLYLIKKKGVSFEVSLDRFQAFDTTSPHQQECGYECEVELIDRERTPDHLTELATISRQLITDWPSAFEISPASKYRRLARSLARRSGKET